MSVGDERPAVILSGLDDVHFVAALRAIFVFPEGSGRGMECETHHGAVSDGVDLRTVSRLADEGIVFWNRSILVEAEGFPDSVHWILRSLLVPVVRGGQKKRAVGRKEDTRC